MDLIFELILRSIIVNGLGLYSRYYFFNMIGKTKSISYLKGEKSRDVDSISQSVFNTVIGLVVLAIISFSMVYFYFGIINPN